MQYLSPEWLEAADRALGGNPALKEATAELDLTLEQVVTDAPASVAGDGPTPGHGDSNGDSDSNGEREEAGGTVTWHLRVDHGHVRLAAGPAKTPDLRFTTTYATAAAVATGALGAQRAFSDGRLRVGGDVGALGRHHRAFAAVDDALAPVRAVTTFPEGAPPGGGAPSPEGPSR